MPHSQHNVLIPTGQTSQIEPVIFGYQDTPPSHYFGPTVRTHWLIHYIVSGKGIFRIDGITYSVTEGMMFVIPPYVETFYQADNEDPWSYMWIGFTCSGDLPVKLAPVISCPNAGPIFRAMKKCSEYKNGRAFFLCGKLWDLFALFGESDITQKDLVGQSLQIIHIEYMTDLTVQKLADRLSLDRSYFSSIFRKRMGMSPGRYLLKCRMECAMELLQNYKCSVTVTAKSVGYCDVYTFSKMFKRYYGFSPSTCTIKNKRGEMNVSTPC